jgi:agmatine deiminase
MRKTWSILVVASALVLSCTLLLPLVSAGVEVPPNPVPPPAGYRMPAEWEPHKATWLSWGHEWEEEAIRGLQVQMIDALQEGEEVHVLVDAARQERAVWRMMKLAGVPQDNVFVHIIPADDIWIRDWAPTWINKGKTQACIDWVFDGWGESSLHWDLSNLADREIANLLGQTYYSYVDYVVESSACFAVNGRELCITTDSLINPGIRTEIPTREEIEEAFTAYLGVKEFIWLTGYLPGDTYTYGHANTMVKFVNKDTVFCNWQPDPNGPAYDVCKDNYDTLVDAGLNVVKVNVMQNYLGPGGGVYPYGVGPFVAGYINSYIGNDVVLVPQYGDPRDATALEIYEEYFPDRTVIGLDCRLLQRWGGAINCITQQQPAV